MAAMKDVYEIRLANLEALVKEIGTAEALAEAAGLSPVYLSQIRSRAIDRKTGKPRNLGGTAARKLEVAAKKSPGWLDQDHTDQPIPAAWPFKNISPRRYYKLPEHERGVIEGRALNILEEWENANDFKSGQRRAVEQ